MEEQTISPAAVDKQKADKFALIGLGLEVVDREGDKVGKVDSLYAGSSEHHPTETVVLPALLVPTSQQTGPAVEPVFPITNTVTVPDFDSALHPDDDFPKELRERLLHDGFIRVEAGFLKRHRYVLRDQIERVEKQRVVLNVAEHELIKH